jgi:hypothetical protein
MNITEQRHTITIISLTMSENRLVVLESIKVNAGQKSLSDL